MGGERCEMVVGIGVRRLGSYGEYLAVFPDQEKKLLVGELAAGPLDKRSRGVIPVVVDVRGKRGVLVDARAYLWRMDQGQPQLAWNQYEYLDALEDAAAEWLLAHPEWRLVVPPDAAGPLTRPDRGEMATLKEEVAAMREEEADKAAMAAKGTILVGPQ
jgi:hypothetical protein